MAGKSEEGGLHAFLHALMAILAGVVGLDFLISVLFYFYIKYTPDSCEIITVYKTSVQLHKNLYGPVWSGR